MSDCDWLVADFKMNARDLLHKSAKLDWRSQPQLVRPLRYQFQTSVVNYTLSATEIAYQAASKLLGSVVWLAPLALSAS